MKIGMITDCLPGTDFNSLVGTAARLGIDMLEFGCGNWSSAPHLDLERMLASEAMRRDFKARLAAHGIGISALNCSGNPLHPGESGRRHDDVTRKTIKLASLLGVERVVQEVGAAGGELNELADVVDGVELIFGVGINAAENRGEAEVVG